MNKTLNPIDGQALRLVDRCLHQGLLKQAEALQYYWPASMSRSNRFLNGVPENNLALHLARSFGENGFQVWAEIPIPSQDGEKKDPCVDFMAYHYELNILAALELKNGLETPQNNVDDFYRLVRMAKEGFVSADHSINNAMINDCPNRYYGLVSFIYDQGFAEWWKDPAFYKYMPPSPPERIAPDYETLGRIVEKSDSRYVVPLVEQFQSPKMDEEGRRFCRAVYALFTTETLKSHKSQKPRA